LSVDAINRQHFISLLDDTFDKYLVTSKNIQTLSFALNDEEFAVCEAAMTVFGRIWRHNPAIVLPLLHRSLLQLVSVLKFSQME
jgi:phosphatidylinositol kinase/protein kinase (PI-3  family)